VPRKRGIFMTTIMLEGGKKHRCKATDRVHCITHNVEVKYGQLSEIGLICLHEGIDSTEDLPCLLLDNLKNESD
jgi:hypothetical protein